MSDQNKTQEAGQLDSLSVVGGSADLPPTLTFRAWEELEEGDIVNSKGGKYEVRCIATMGGGPDGPGELWACAVLLPNTSGQK